MYCSRDYYYSSRFNQQYEKPTPIIPSEFDKKGQPISGYGQERTILKGYNGNPIQQYGIRVILGKWNNEYWRFVPVLLGLNTLRKMEIFIEHPSVTTETSEIHPELQNLTRYDKKHMESMDNSQGAAEPAKQTQHIIQAEPTMTCAE